MNKLKNVKAFVKEHKKEVALGALAAVNLGVGVLAGSMYTQYRISSGLEKFHNAGFIKFFDPATNLEVTVEEVNKLLNKAYS